LLDLCIDQILLRPETTYLRAFLTGSDSGLIALPPFLFHNTPLSRRLWKALFIETAFLAATFHDLGYPWQYVNRLNSKLEHAGYLKDSPSADAEKLVRDFGNRLLFCPLKGYKSVGLNAPSTWSESLVNQTAAALRDTHGLPGAIGFLYLNDVLRDYPEGESALREFCVEWAAMAVLMHDMNSVYWGQDGTSTLPENRHLRLKFNIDPLSCIVTLADLMQDFERPSVEFCPHNATEILARYPSEGAETMLDYGEDNRLLRITFKCANAAAAARKSAFLRADQDSYFDPQYGYLDLSACGVDRTELIVTS